MRQALKPGARVMRRLRRTRTRSQKTPTSAAARAVASCGRGESVFGTAKRCHCARVSSID
jgi:hypothetical protein